MVPYFHLFSLEIPAYGAMVVVGLILAVIYEKIRERSYPDIVRHTDLVFVYCAVGALVGAKLLYLILALPSLAAELRTAEDTWRVVKAYLAGGFVFYGGFYGCIGAMGLYCRSARISFDRTARLFLPMFPLIHGFGRIGCFLVGCCYGSEAGDSPLAVTFRHSPVAPNGVPLYPVQLMEAAAELALFAVLAILGAKKLSGTKMLALYCGVYGAMRFVLEFWRGDAYRGIWLGLSTSQYISLFTIALALVLTGWCRKRRADSGT